MEARRPLLLEALNRLYPPVGQHRRLRWTVTSAISRTLPLAHVSLVGAGPGDPGLLTRKAIARLRAADLVLYDALIDERILRLRAARAALLRRQARRAAMR